jgi:hypothetical protein
MTKTSGHLDLWFIWNVARIHSVFSLNCLNARQYEPLRDDVAIVLTLDFRSGVRLVVAFTQMKGPDVLVIGWIPFHFTLRQVPIFQEG